MTNKIRFGLCNLFVIGIWNWEFRTSSSGRVFKIHSPVLVCDERVVRTDRYVDLPFAPKRTPARLDGERLYPSLRLRPYWQTSEEWPPLVTRHRAPEPESRARRCE